MSQNVGCARRNFACLERIVKLEVFSVLVSMRAVFMPSHSLHLYDQLVSHLKTRSSFASSFSLWSLCSPSRSFYHGTVNGSRYMNAFSNQHSIEINNDYDTHRFPDFLLNSIGVKSHRLICKMPRFGECE